MLANVGSCVQGSDDVSLDCKPTLEPDGNAIKLVEKGSKTKSDLDKLDKGKFITGICVR